MLTRLRIRNFKRFADVDIELGDAVVFVGANNSGKSTCLQALALWDVGVRRWNEKRKGKSSPEKRPGVTINRRDLISIPIPDANLLWRGLHVRNVDQVVIEKDGKQQRKPQTTNIRIDIIVDGVTADSEWSCGLEFDYANSESLYCRPLRTDDAGQPTRMAVPEQAASTRAAYLPPMSGLAAVEPVWEPGRINVLVGEGQTAQVLRNLCHLIYTADDTNGAWRRLVAHVRALFGVELHPPTYVAERGEITMQYDEHDSRLDLSSSGRGLQQTLLLLAHLYANPGTILLLDEPDAHLEILRQRQIYKLLTDVAREQGSQIIAASHSEVVLNEAAERDVVVAFVGKPHRIDNRGSQVVKALKEIGFEHYYQAEQSGWVLYLEGSTDLAILQAFAQTLGHEAATVLERPFVHYVGSKASAVRKHFWGLREAKDDLVGIALFDRRDRELPDDLGAEALVWKRREIENYLCQEQVLMAYAKAEQSDDLFGQRRQETMAGIIQELGGALRTLGMDPWSPDIKATDEFLDILFRSYFNKLGLPNLLRKTDYHVLARFVALENIDPEVREKLDSIVRVARRAVPRTEPGR
jgi:ABC-type lipoprotein export system ATPase subunit